jgi:hypothetical protein
MAAKKFDRVTFLAFATTLAAGSLAQPDRALADGVFVKHVHLGDAVHVASPLAPG